VIGLSGAMRVDPAKCNPSKPLPILAIHGTKDDVVPYDGGDILGAEVSSAIQTVSYWAGYNKCTAKTPRAVATNVNIETTHPNTTIYEFDGCPTTARIQLWSVVGNLHVTEFAPGAVTRALQFFSENLPKPSNPAPGSSAASSSATRLSLAGAISALFVIDFFF
jgi:polyhydroxybutyrate depolymerase